MYTSLFLPLRNLAHNKLVGSLPDLSDMKSMNYV